jgi:predicted nucleic acid-binding protein
MILPPKRIFLDTNIYIIGVADSSSNERKILNWLGLNNNQNNSIEVIVSEELFNQILRVSKRLKNKDWGSKIVNKIWHNFNVYYISVEPQELVNIESLGVIPREDVGIYLTASKGQAKCFVSTNHKLIQSLVKETGEFECLIPSEFVKKYLYLSL